MMDNARQGEIDLILTKSISRFARNTVDCLNFIRELREINVDIFFDKENIYSSDPKVDFLLTIMSSIAQEEARNVSENIKWNVQKRFNNGTPIVNHSRFLGYTKLKRGGNLVVDHEAAETIKLIFNMYINGHSSVKIAKHLESIKALTGTGKTKWWSSGVDSILKNEKYMGDLIQQKTITVDYLTHRKVKNKDIAPKYHLENSHEAIIDKETFLLAQRLRVDRGMSAMGENKDTSKYNARYPFSSFIVCSECGRKLMRRFWNYNFPSQRIMQQCGGYIEGKAHCKAKATSQEMLEGATIQMINEVFLKENDIVSTIKNIIKSTIKVSDVELKINQLQDKVADIDKMISNLIDIQVKNSTISERDFSTKYQSLTSEQQQIQIAIKQLECEYLETYDTRARLDKIEKMLNNFDQPITDFDSATLRAFIYRMISVKPDEIVFCVAGKKNYSDKEFSKRRHEFESLEPLAEGVYRNEMLKKTMKYKVVII